MATDTLTTNREYVLPGTYIGEDIQPANVTLAPDARVPTYLGKGSQYILVSNDTIVRGYVNNAPLTFSKSSPWNAVLPTIATGDTDTAVLADSTGIEVSKGQWYFSDDLKSIYVSDSAYNPASSYLLSYQGNDTSLPDAIPTSDLRVLSAIGSQLDQSQYKRNTDFFIDVATDAPAASVDDTGAVVQQANPTTSFSGITHTGTGTGTVALDAYAEYTHNYTRAYTLKVVSVSGTVTTFSWTATPVSAGNESTFAVPLTPSIDDPTFTVDSTSEQTWLTTLELGARLSLGGSGYVVGDTYTFTGYGPSLIENDSAQLNTNQYATATPVVGALDNTNTGSLIVDASTFTGVKNLLFKAEIIEVDPGAVDGTLPVGSVTFTGAPADGGGVTVDNGRTGVSKTVKTFEFDSNGVQTIAGSTLVTEPVTAAVPATGIVQFTGSASDTPADGATVTLTDGVRTVVFEFDADGVLTNPGATRVILSSTPGSQSANTAANLTTAITSSTLRITPTNVSSGNGGVGKLTLVNQVAGVIGNASIAVSGVGVIASGFSGGADASVSVSGTVTNFVAAVNAFAASLSMIAVVDAAVSTQVNLKHGARFVLSALPLDGETLTVLVGGVSTVFKFTATSVLATDITIGVTPMATLATAATVIAGVASVLTLASSSTLVVVPKTGRNISLTSAIGTVIPSVVDDPASTSNGNVAITGTNLTNVQLAGFTGGADASVSPDRVTVAWGTAGDAFTSGVSVLQDGTSTVLYENVALGLSKATAAAAIATVHLVSNPADADLVVVPDGILVTPVTFEFDTGFPVGVGAGHTAVVVGATPAASATNLAAAINNSALQVTAVAIGSTVTLTLKKNGAGPGNAYNTPVTTTSSVIQVIGFAGGQSNYSAGDTFTWTVKAPRRFVTALDDRTTTLVVTQVGSLSDPNTVGVLYESNTAEGGFGELSADTANDGYISLPGQIRLAVRNASRFAIGDRFTVTHTNNGKLYWTLNAKSNEVFTASDVLTDRNGSVTGKYGALYINLANAPISGTLKILLGAAVFTAYTQLSNSSIIVLNVSDVTALASGLTVSYTYEGNEPAIGTTYYVSGQYKRPDSYYNTPYIFYDLRSAKSFLAPITADNDLAIAVELAFDQAQAPQAVAVIQIKDADGDGSFSNQDIDNALSGAKEVYYETDIVPLRLQKYLSKFLAFNVTAADPFEKREHMFYYGAAVGTPIGSSSVSGSVIYTAKTTLQVFGTSYAHGSRVMTAPRMAKKTITLSDNTSVTVVLDGSFVAAATAACVAGMPTYSQTLLKTKLLGFDYVETFGASTNIALGAANIIFFSDAGSGVYVFEEDQTVDNYTPEFHEILPMRTKQDVTRTVRREMDASVIGMVPNTKGDAKATVAARLMQILITLVNNGVTAPYQDDSGNVRQINSSDVEVFADSAGDYTKFNFIYGFYTRFAIKRLYGLYVTNKSVAG